MTIDTYEHIAASYVKATRDLQPREAFEAFCQVISPGGLVVDAGCGWGRDCLALAERGFSVIGVDLSTEMLKIASGTAPACHFMPADLREIPLEECYVDGIWCCASLLHLERSQVPKALAEFKRLLKTGAVCCILVKKGIGDRIVRGGHARGKPRYFTYFLADELYGLCISQGFTILDVRTTLERKSHKREGRHQEWICVLMRKP